MVVVIYCKNIGELIKFLQISGTLACLQSKELASENSSLWPGMYYSVPSGTTYVYAI